MRWVSSIVLVIGVSLWSLDKETLDVVVPSDFYNIFISKAISIPSLSFIFPLELSSKTKER